MVAYFIQCGQDGPIKIGKAVDVYDRLSNLQIGCPYELRLLGTTNLFSESSLHRKFAGFRLRGEWFSSCPELLEFIASLSKENSRPEIILDEVDVDGTPILPAYESQHYYVVWCDACSKCHFHSKEDGHRHPHCMKGCLTGTGGTMHGRYQDTGYILRRVGRCTLSESKLSRFRYNPFGK